MTKKKVLLVVGILIGIFCVVGISYAIWQLTLKQTETNKMSTACFNVKLQNEKAPIQLEEVFPVTDEEGSNFNPYEFTITNNCNELATYQINLEVLTSSSLENLDYIKASLNDDIKILTQNESVKTTITEANKAYKLKTGDLKPKESQTFYLRLWMDENTPTVEDAMNAGYMGKITINSSYLPLNPMSGVMVPMQVSFIKAPGEPISVTVNETYSQNQKYNGRIEKVVFQSHLNPYEDAIEVVDFSVPKDQSVMGYYVKNGKTTISDLEQVVLYIQADGKIKVNPNGMGYFSLGFEEGEALPGLIGFYPISVHIIGLENIDTTEVTNMQQMFAGVNNKELDLTNFNTEKATNMSEMFYECSSLIKLYLSSFNTSNVTDMTSMFFGCSALNTIIYGDNFIYVTDTNIENMFDGCSANKPVHESWSGITL